VTCNKTRRFSQPCSRTSVFQSSHLEHLSGALAVAGGDEGGVHVQEAVGLEELMRGKGQGVADAGHRADGVGSRPQMRLED